MGNILSAIDDDIDEYERLCDQYGEKPVDVYGLHAEMLEELHRDCHNNIPPAKWSLRIQRFREEYKKALEDKENELNRRKQRFKELHSQMSSDDIDILHEGKREHWSTS